MDSSTSEIMHNIMDLFLETYTPSSQFLNEV